MTLLWFILGIISITAFILFFGIAAASYMGDVSSQRAVIKHYTLKGYGNGVSARFFNKAINYGYGIGGIGYGKPYVGGLSYARPYVGGLGSGVYGGLAYDGIDNLGLAYTNRDLADGYGRLGYGYGGQVL